MSENKNFKKISFNRKGVSNLYNNQMNVVLGGREVTFVHNTCPTCNTVNVETCNCGTHHSGCGEEQWCPTFTQPSGSSICYDICY